MSRDRLFAHGHDLVDFTFDERVAHVFPDMIRRSVPGYETVLAIAGLLASRHMPRGGRCYDLGCSLGASARALLSHLEDADARVIAVDNSAAMLETAKALNEDEPRIAFCEADVRDVAIDAADVVFLNYTLQFVPLRDRLPLLARIRRGLRPSGVLIVSEKLRFESPAQEAYYDTVHLDFKRANGYSALEIAAKRAALENVMRPETETRHLERLSEAGFARAETWFRCLNWASFLACP